MILDVVQAPNDVLAAKAKAIGKLDDTTLKFIEDMKETLVAQKDPEGIGLAAPQVGKSLQIFVIKPDHEAPFDIYINPVLELMPEKAPKKKIQEEKKEKEKLEGCLSLKIIWGTVKRAKKVRLKWTSEKGEQHDAYFSGFYATILQHEYDHLQGILFPRRVLEQKGRLYKSRKDKDGQDIFDPVEI